MGVTSVDIDTALLAEAKDVLGTSTIRTTVDRALRDAVMRQRQRAAVEGIAAMDLDPDPRRIDYPHDSP